MQMLSGLLTVIGNLESPNFWQLGIPTFCVSSGWQLKILHNFIIQTLNEYEIMKDTQKSRRVIMWNKVKELSEIGLNKTQIAMELSIDRKTVKKMLNLKVPAIEWITEKQYLINQHPLGTLNCEKMRNPVCEKMGKFIC